MPTNEWNSIDEYSKTASEHYCAFLDIVGYKDKSDKYFKGEFNLLGRFKRALSHSLSIINISSVLIDISQLNIKFFSDSIVLSLPKKSNGNDTLFGLINTCKILSAHLSFEGLFVRGGLSTGLHENHVDNEYGFEFLASSALEKAYKIESEQATYPRIIVDREVFPCLSIEAKQLLIHDSGELIVHFAPQLINSNGENQDIILAEMKHIESIMLENDDQRIIDKYQWLLDYYYWTLTTTKNVDLDLFKSFVPKSFNSFKRLCG